MEIVIYTELSLMSSALRFWLMGEGETEQVSKVEVNDVLGDEYQEPSAFQVLRTTCAMPQTMTSLRKVWRDQKCEFLYSRIFSDSMNLDNLLEFSEPHLHHLENGYGWVVMKNGDTIYVTFHMKHSIRYTFTVHVLCGCVWTSGLYVLSEHDVNNCWESCCKVWAHK